MTVPPPERQGAAAGRSGTVAVTVVVDEAHRQSIESVGARLRDEGLHVDQVLPTLGLITGRLAEDRLPAARRVEGVSAVEPQHGFRLPPPEAPVQ